MIRIYGSSDVKMNNIAGVLYAFGYDYFRRNNSSFEVELYRIDEWTIRMRIVSAVFETMNLYERHRKVWDVLADVTEDAVIDLTSTVLVTPAEKLERGSSLKFDKDKPEGVTVELYRQ